MSSVAAKAAARSEVSAASGGSWATRIRTSSGWRATSASALTAPPLLAKRSTGPPPAAAITAWMSSACCSGVDSVEGSSFVLRSTPRGS